MKHFLIILLIISFSTVLFSQDLVINEFMAANDTTAADQDGEYDDWIELYNNSARAISLNGYFLSDEDSDIAQWAFPDTVIGVGDFLIIWTDSDSEQSGLHADFRLSASGEAIYLSGPDTVVVDQITFGTQTTDISTGRFPNGTGGFKAMYPTFSAPNTGEDPEHEYPSDIIFNDALIHNFDLRFYVDNWKDSLKYYFEELDEEYMPAQMIYNDSLVYDSIGVRYKGNSSYIQSSRTPKKPFKFRFDKYIDDQIFFGIGRLNFHNCVNDPSFMREKIAYDIARQYMPAPRTGYANIYVEEELIGFYVIVEQIDRIFLDRRFTDNRGNLYKAGVDGANMSCRGEDRSDYEDQYELKTNEDENDWSRLIAMLDRLNNTPADEFVETIRDYLDIDNCIRHLAFNMVLSHFDSYTGSARNYYLYDDEPAGQFKIIHWDMNEAFGVYTNNWDMITQDVVDLSNIEIRPLIRRILENDSLRLVYLDYIHNMATDAASYDSITAMAERIKPIIENHVQADNNKLYSYQDFLDNIENDVRIDFGKLIPGIKSFSRARNLNLLLQLSDDIVHPGDTDNNGVVNALDVLPVGVYFLNEGNPRGSVSFAWESQRTVMWNIPAATYADANGDGVINERDIIGIGINWGNTHNNTNATLFEIDPSDITLLNRYIDNFYIIYNSLSGKNEPVTAIKALLESVLDIDAATTAAYSLDQNYPNPFNPETVISFSLPENNHVTLSIFNLSGQIVFTLIAGQLLKPGHYEYILDSSKLSTGMYFYRIETENWRKVRSMTVIK